MTQREMAFFAELPEPELLPESCIDRCRDEHDALMLCIERRRVKYPFRVIAEQLGIDKGHLSRIMAGEAHFPTTKRMQLMALCGNYAPLQFEARSAGFTLAKRDPRAEKIQALEAELLQLRASA